jgi:hypothetical protein
MSEAPGTEKQQNWDAASQEEMMSALFAQLVMQQANMAMMFLGKVAHPESGQVTKNLEASRLFIDQLEMLEVKTKGNLSKEEADLLKRSLMTLRLAFVEAVEAPEEKKREEQTVAEGAKPAEDAAKPAEAPKQEEESHKKFSKKY